MTTSKKINLLIISNIVCWCIVIAIVSTGFIKSNSKPFFNEIDANRINILGENGKPVMVLANKKLIPGPSMNGKDYSPEIADGRQYLSGIIFFNEQGDEVGGLIYNGIKKNDSTYSAVAHFSFDQWKQNQVVALQYLDNTHSRRAGLRVWDRPTNVSMDKQLDLLQQFKDSKSQLTKDSISKQLKLAQNRGENGVERLFIGSQDEVAQIQLRDKSGRMRAKLYIDEQGEPKLDFLNEKGEVVKRYPANN